MSGANNSTSVYVDLSTFDEIEELLYAGASAANIFHARITKCIWFGHIPIRLRHSGTRNFNETFVFTQPRQGDYATYSWARITLPQLAARSTSGYELSWADDIGHQIFKEIIFSVNDIPLQKYSQLYLEHRAHHSVDESHWSLYQNMIGNTTDVTTPTTAATAAYTMVVPLWAFYQKAGAAFPHSCIPYADIKWEFTLRQFDRCVKVQGAALNTVLADGTDYVATPPTLTLFELWTNYAVLTQDMRSRMGAIPRQMLIDQVNETGPTLSVTSSGSDETTVDLRFSYHMVWLTFVAQNVTRGTALAGDAPQTAGYQFTNYTDDVDGDGNSPIDNATVLYENSERLDKMPADYYSWVVPFFHFEAGPRKTGFHTWSLAYYDNSYNPTGGMNVSRMFNLSVKLTTRSDLTSGTFKALFLAQVKQIILFSGGGIIIEFH